MKAFTLITTIMTISLISTTVFANVWVNERLSCTTFLSEDGEPEVYDKNKHGNKTASISFNVSYLQASPTLSSEESSYIRVHKLNGFPSFRFSGNYSYRESNEAFENIIKAFADESNSLSRYIRPAQYKRPAYLGGMLYTANEIEKVDLLQLFTTLGANYSIPFTQEDIQLITIQNASNRAVARGQQPASIIDHNTGLYRLSFSDKRNFCLQAHYPFNVNNGQSFHLCYSCRSQYFKKSNSLP